jgi:hypothetical protein
MCETVVIYIYIMDVLFFIFIYPRVIVDIPNLRYGDHCEIRHNSTFLVLLMCADDA